jgi:hypothetical protein
MMDGEFTIPWASYLSLGSFVYDLAEQVFGLPDPLSEFISLFSGRPTLQATLDVASIYDGYTSPTLKMLALGAAASLNAGLPLSQSSGDPIFGPYFEAALRIEQAIRWSAIDGSTQAVESATLASVLNEASNPGTVGTATLQAVESAFQAFSAGNWPGGSNPTAIITQLADTTYTDQASLLAQGWAQSWLGEKPVKPAATPATPPAPAQPPLLNQPAPPPAQPDIAQVVDQCCIAAVKVNYQQVEQLAGANSIGFQGVEQLAGANTIAYQGVEQLAYVATVLGQLPAILDSCRISLGRIHHKLPPTAALEQIVQELTCICTALSNLSTGTGTPIDTTGIVTALTNINATLQAQSDYPDLDATTAAQIDWLSTFGLLDPSISQLSSS